MRLTSLILLLLLADSGFAAPDVQIQTRLEPSSGLHVGQPVSFEIDVLTDTWLAGTPDFDTLTLPDALVEFEGSQGRSIQRDIGGKRYFGVTFSYRLVPLESGVITVPALPVKVSVGQADTPIGATAPSFSFPVQPLSGPDTTRDMLLAGDVQLTQRIIPSGVSVQAGQPVIREIHVVADRALPLAIPPLTTYNPSGSVGTHLSADINPLTNGRGYTTGGERIERIRYIPELAGAMSLPAMVLKWWDIDENRVEETMLPALEVQVIPPAGSRAPFPTELMELMRLQLEWFGRQNPMVWLLLAAIACACVWPARRYGSAVINFCLVSPLSHCQHSKLRLRFRAIRQLRGPKPVLNGVYRLIRRIEGRATIRGSDVPRSYQEQLLEALSLYYKCNPNRPCANQHLRKGVRGLARRRHGKPKSRLVGLNPRLSGKE